jgi:hypothetical protein
LFPAGDVVVPCATITGERLADAAADDRHAVAATAPDRTTPVVSLAGTGQGQTARFGGARPAARVTGTVVSNPGARSGRGQSEEFANI